jgi:MFS family permease
MRLLLNGMLARHQHDTREVKLNNHLASAVRSYFKDLRFVTVFIASALGTFPLFVPPFFLPLYGTSMGLSHSASAGLAAGFNLASAVGRIAFGQLADWIGPINALIIAFAVNSISLLLVWPLSGTVGPLVVFVILTGVAAGELLPFTHYTLQLSKLTLPMHFARRFLLTYANCGR